MARVIKNKTVNDDWLDVKKSIHFTILKFCKKTKCRVLDYDEAMAEASVVYLKCLKTLDKTKAALKTWVCFKVWKHLQSLYRKEVRRNKLFPVHLESDFFQQNNNENSSDFAESNLCTVIDPVSKRKDDFNVYDFLTTLPDEASLLVWLVFNPPNKLKEQSKQAILSYLKNAGWSTKRIDSAFRTVRKSLRFMKKIKRQSDK